VLRGLRELRLYLAVLAWWATLLTVPLWPLPAATRAGALLALALGPLALMAWRKRSFARATYSVVSWCVQAAGLVRGFFTPRQPPRALIPSLVLQEPNAVRHKGQELFS
jgi:hypothetical protein